MSTKIIQMLIQTLLERRDPRIQVQDQHDAGGPVYRQLRELDAWRVRECVRKQEPIARVDVAERTGFARSTVSSIVDQLIEEGWISESLPRKGEQEHRQTVGRRSIALHFNAKIGAVLGIDMGRRHLTMELADLAGQKIGNPITFSDFRTDYGPDICIPRVIKEARRFVDEFDIWDQVIAIGFSVPAALNKDLCRIWSPPLFPESWNGVDVTKPLREAFGRAVYSDNDANLAALAENREGIGQGVANMLYLKVVTGVGGGIIIGGKLYRGEEGSAGELGHITLNERGRECKCGSYGCLESLASIPRIIEDACKGTSLRDIFEGRWQSKNVSKEADEDVSRLSTLSGRSEVTIVDVFQAALAGDKASITALEHAGERFGLALAGAINMLNPSLVIMGGALVDEGVRLNAADYFFKPLKEMTSKCGTPAARKTQIVLSKLGPEASVRGAIATALEIAFDMPPSLPIATAQ